MACYVEGWSRSQSLLLPECVDDYVDQNNPVRVVDAFADELNLAELGFGRALPAETGRPAYHPAMMLKLYIYGYLNRIPSSRRLEREAQRNIELVWLTGRLAPDFKTIADFRRDNGSAIRATCPKVRLPASQQRSDVAEVLASPGTRWPCCIAQITCLAAPKRQGQRMKFSPGLVRRSPVS